MIKISQVIDQNGSIHFESLSQNEAERFIKDYDNEYGVILDLYELDREPTDHRNKTKS
jgi:hypothetical protein